MIRTGDSITNPVTGKTVTFRRTSADTDGEMVVVEVTLERGGFVAAAHVHRNRRRRSGFWTDRSGSASATGGGA